MNTTKPVICAMLICVLCAAKARSASVFQNLSFENPNMPFVPDPSDSFDRIPIDQVMPGWKAYLGDHPLDVVGYNDGFLSLAGVSLYDTAFFRGGPIISGTYTAFLQSGGDSSGFTGQDVSASLAQSGFVGTRFRSVQMKIWSNAPFSVSMDGQRIEMVVLDQQPTYTLYGGDITSFGGREAELRITSDLYFSPLIGGFGRMSLDDIQFSTMVVPEPSTWMLLALGGLLAGSWMRFRRGRSA